MEVCTLSGTVYQADGVTPRSGGKIYVRKCLKDGELISTKDLPATIGTDGTFSFTVPRASTAWIEAPVEGFDRRNGYGVAVTIPDAATADLKDLLPAISPPSTAVSQAALNAHTAKLANPDDPGHIVGVTGALTLADGVLGLGDLDASYATDAQLTAERVLWQQGDSDTLEAANAYTDSHVPEVDLSDYALLADPRFTDARTPAGGAGGVLSGSYPNPGFAVDMATQGELDTVAGAVTAEVSRAQDAEALLVPATRTVNGHALSADVTVTKADVGLGNAENTSDANKPVSTAQQAAIDTASTADRARANHTGTQSADTLTDGTTNKAFTATERTKLSGMATGATANSSDATLLARANHTGTQTASTISDFNAAAVAVPASVNAQTGTTYTLQASDSGKVVTCSNASAITVTVPSGLGAGFNCMVVQLGAGAVTFTASGVTINNRQGFTKTAGQFATASLVAYAANTFISGGDMSA